jgi:tRNA A-37 threonylcarbamoyl transferase component Bud32
MYNLSGANMVVHIPETDTLSITHHGFPNFAWLSLKQRFPEFSVAGAPEKLSGGLLNYVWRVRGQNPSDPASIIVKWAPAYIASAPDVWLDPDRILIEARAMFALGKIGESIRPPRLYSLDEANHVILMEDLGQAPDLGQWLSEPHSHVEAQGMGTSLGRFIGALHRTSATQPGLALIFDNHTIQRTRLEFHYGNIQAYAQRASLADAAALGERAVWLGKLLQQPGICLNMGDLWPSSVIVTDSGLRIIDWELAHYGRPSQDIGHLSAHLWMIAHRARQVYTAQNARTMQDAFLQSYRRTLGSQYDSLFGLDGVIESSVHFGSEIFARAVGTFQNDYVYSGLAPDHPVVQAAVQAAAAHIRNPWDMHTFDLLGRRAG